jgi:hypothetical protein
MYTQLLTRTLLIAMATMLLAGCAVSTPAPIQPTQPAATTAPTAASPAATQPVATKAPEPTKATVSTSAPVPATTAATTTPVKILFVGNSYTYGRIAPVLQYNTANVQDLTKAFNDVAPAAGSFPIGSGTLPNPCATPDVGCYNLHPWGGVPGIFKKMTDQIGLRYEVAISARGAATLRGHFLNTASSDWNLRGNLASQKWDVVVLQGQSDEPLPPARSKNGNPIAWRTYLDKLIEYVHLGTASNTTEAQIFASLANCTADPAAATPGPGLSANSCNIARTIPANPNANPAAKIYLYQTWARPDMVEPHKCIDADNSTLDGRPKLDPTCNKGADGSATTGENNIFYTRRATTAENLADMTADLRAAFKAASAANSRVTGVVPVGDAFQLAVDQKVVKSSNFYNAAGVYDNSGTLMDLWWLDRTHASVHGSYLAALTMFAKITGIDPTTLGGDEVAAKELGISKNDAITLQRIARDSVLAK